MLPNNLKYLRQKQKLSQEELAKAIGVPRTTLGDYERGKTEPNLEKLLRLSDYFDTKVDDLLRKNLSHRDLEVLRNKDLRVLAISVDKDNRNNIELVDTKAEAGYLESFQDPEYIRDLPKISFPDVPEGTFRGFQIEGDSMLPMESGNIVICAYVERLDQIKDDRTYVVVSQHEGLVYKRVKVDTQNRRLILISDNELYMPYKIAFDQIDEIWEYYAHMGFSDAKSTFEYMLGEKINDIQKKVTEIHQKQIR